MPTVAPEGRSYVVDGGGIESFPVNDYDYRDLFSWAVRGGDFLLLEWDIAIQRSAIAKLERKIKKAPYRVHSVPYQVDSGGELVWVNTNEDWSWIPYGQQTSAHFGFGCTYFPAEIVYEWKPPAMGDTRLTDTNFSRWHFENYGLVPVHWSIPIVHLNV